MIEHILVPLDGSTLAERVLPHLFALARAFDSHITILRVMDQSKSDQPDQRYDPLDWQMREAEARSYLKKMKMSLIQSGLTVRYELLYGDPATRIVEFVQNQDVDLLLLSSHGESGLTGWNISSVVQKTVIRVQKPTMIVRAYQAVQTDHSEAHYKKIFIPLDGSSRAEFVLSLAVSLTNFHKAQLIVAHVVREPELPRRTPPSQEENRLIRELVEKNRREAAHYLSGLQEQFAVNMKTHLIIGEDVADTLHSLVGRENPDLIVMTAHGYSGSAHRPFGSLALNFIAYGTRPLLILQDMPESCEVLPESTEFAHKGQPGH